MHLHWLQTHSCKVLVDKVPKRPVSQEHAFSDWCSHLMELWMDRSPRLTGGIHSKLVSAQGHPCAWPCQACCLTLNVGMGAPMVWLELLSAQHLSNVWGCFGVWIPTLGPLIGLLISLSLSVKGSWGWFGQCWVGGLGWGSGRPELGVEWGQVLSRAAGARCQWCEGGHSDCCPWWREIPKVKTRKGKSIQWERGRKLRLG